MSEIGLKDDKPKAKVPGTVEIVQPGYQPGNNSAPAPDVKGLKAPNIDGGEAQFSSLTTALQNLVQAKTSELSASQDALKANTQIDDTLLASINALSESSNVALNNMQKAESLPGGSQGKIAQIMSLFDSSYNPRKQAIVLEANRTRAAQLSASAEALKNKNNVLPQVLGKLSEASKIVFDAQKEANSLALEAVKVSNAVRQTAIDASRLRIAQSQEARAATDYSIRSMSTEQISRELALAESGKGRFAGRAGLLKERLVHEEAAETALASAKLNLSKGKREEYNASMEDMLQHFPQDILGKLINAGEKTGVVQVPTGQGKEVMEVPLNVAKQALVKNIALDKQVNSAVAQEMTERMNIIPTATNIINAGSAFVSMDPRAGNVVVNMGNLMKDLDAKNPASVRQVGEALKLQQKELDQIVKENASRFSTKDAQNAVEVYGKTGKFDSIGGTAVVVASTGTPSLLTSSFYKSAWRGLADAVARDLQRQRLVQTPSMDGSVSGIDAMSVFAALNQKPTGKETITRTTQNILADPQKTVEIRNAIKGTIQGSAVNGVLYQLAQQKDANPLWNTIIQNIENFKVNGKLSPQKIFEATEQARVISGGKIDFSANFLKGLQNYAINADNAAGANPNYTVQDRALEAALFGGSPNQQVLGGLHYQLRTLAERARAEMAARIQSDVTGKTQKEAYAQAGFGQMLLQAGADPFGNIHEVEKLFKNTGIDPNSVPSATGTGLTAAEVAARYRGGK